MSRVLSRSPLIIAFSVLSIACARSVRQAGEPPLFLDGKPVTFASELPCDTCQLFQFVLNLYPDSTFQYRTYARNPGGYPPLSHVDRGRWSILARENLLRLEGLEEGERALAILTSRKLETRAPDGSPTTWALSYLLTRQAKLDRFDVPFDLDGTLSFDSSGAVYRSCFDRKASVVAPGAQLDSIRRKFYSLPLPQGRVFRVSLVGHFFPVPQRGSMADTLHISRMRNFSWANGCDDPYPAYQIGSAEWRVYEIEGTRYEKSSDDMDMIVTVDTVEKAVSYRIGNCRGGGPYLVDPNRMMMFAPFDVATSTRCTERESQLASSLTRALQSARHYWIQSDILTLLPGRATTRLVATKRIK